jgi:S-formylglutathione hydrolase
MKKTLILRSFALAVAAVVVAQTGCRQAHELLPDHPRTAVGVDLRDVTFHSKALDREMSYRVFLPATLEAGTKLPVVYLLHGGGGGFRDWSNYSDVARYAARKDSFGGLILVMPEGDSSYYMNAAGKPEEKYENYLVNDLIGDVETRFPAAKGRENRAVVGVSMGGFAAVKLALSRPELFVFVGGLSAAIDVPSRRFSWRRWEQSMRFRSIFGPDGSSSRQSADPFRLVQSASVASTPYLYLTAGEREALLAPNRRFAALLKRRGFSYEFHTKPGGHDWSEWDSQIPGCFESLFLHLKPLR